MLELIKEFPEQILKAIEIGENCVLKHKYNNGIKNILVAGLGGSGIGGNLLAELLRDELTVPVIVNKGYFLPAFANDSTLIILSSYSGNTEETISVANQALAKGLKPVCVTSGGKLEQLANENGLDLIKIPAGFPPRACLGYSTTQLFFILHHHALITADFKQALKGTAAFLQNQQDNITREADALAAKLLHKIIIVYAEDKYESVALRLKQQINENSKMHCWYNVIPEMNHNELVGWREQHDNIAVLAFKTEDAFYRNTSRLLFFKEVAATYTNNFNDIEAQGANTFERHFYLIHLGDWLSYRLAILKGADPVEIVVINNLKSHLNSIQAR